MKRESIKYIRGAVIKNESNNLLILNDVYMSSKEIICIIVDSSNKPYYEKIISIPNGDYKILKYIHRTVVDFIVQKILEFIYADDENKSNQIKLLNSLNYKI